VRPPKVFTQIWLQLPLLMLHSSMSAQPCGPSPLPICHRGELVRRILAMASHQKQTSTSTHTHTDTKSRQQRAHTHTHINIYIYMQTPNLTHTHTYTDTAI
jgi:hypothetical protein